MNFTLALTLFLALLLQGPQTFQGMVSVLHLRLSIQFSLIPIVEISQEILPPYGQDIVLHNMQSKDYIFAHAWLLLLQS